MIKFKDLNSILLVDDDLPTNFIHTKVIQKAAIEVQTKALTNAQEALDFLTYTGSYAADRDFPRPGIIFLDINMPGLSGWDFMDAYHLLDDRYKARAVVIMLTTSINPADEARALKNKEIVTYLRKPLRPEMVLELAAKYFEEL